MPRTHFPPEIKARLEYHNKVRQFEKRQLIDSNIDKLVALVSKNRYVRKAKANKNSGCISFSYHGRSVQYWIGSAKMVVRNPIAYTEYTDFLIPAFKRELEINDPMQAFKCEKPANMEAASG